MAASPAALADLLNAAYAESRALPRLVAWPVERPLLTTDDVLKAREHTPDEFVVERDGRVVSGVAARAGQDGTGYVAWFVTHPDHRRQGLASDCLQRALGFLRAQGCSKVQTAAFVDSRVTSACAFLEHHGFTVRDPEHQNIVMQIDMTQYEPAPIAMPEGYHIEPLQPEWVPQWLQVKDRVFGGTSAPDWFEKTFSHRWDFEWEGWMTLWRGDEMIGISGADLFRDPAHREHYSGAQIEYVGMVEGHRGLRLGEIIVRACLDYIKARDLPCQLITQRFRVPAVTLYEKLGFRFQRENRTYEKTL
ncbi:GNAT family N-acetyltransferase [bacterium]|nr:GNAT family N-acetyltransferase [bacterium]